MVLGIGFVKSFFMLLYPSLPITNEKIFSPPSLSCVKSVHVCKGVLMMTEEAHF